MSRNSFVLDDRLYDYLLDVSLREPAVLKALREETAKHEMARMQIAPEQGQFIQWLLRLMGARRGIEVGVFTGYSSLCAALAMGEEAYLLACDVSEEYTAVARCYWAQAGVESRIDLRLAEAQRTLEAALAKGEAGSYDYAFIDADKTSYSAYYESCLTLLRPGGVILVDNVLWGGRVADPKETEEDTVALRTFNKKLADDERIDLSLIPLADGISLCRKRG
ncbi:MAG: class I SAM-dependent methyltransferase [Salinisphaeraceae bacterium]|nr:class I SAM-dependent methyltransferase [Salinisphaeraceae bacterium]